MVSKISDEARPVYDHLRQQVTWLQRRRQVHRALFEVDTAVTIERLREIGGDDFRTMVEQDIRNEMVLAVGRLVARHEQKMTVAGKEVVHTYLSLEYLARLVLERSPNDRLRRQLNKRIDRARRLWGQRLKDQRNLRVGHGDRAALLGSAKGPERAAILADIDSILPLFSEFLSTLAE